MGPCIAEHATYGANHSDGPDAWIKIYMEGIALGLLTLWRLLASHWIGFCSAQFDHSVSIHLHQALDPNSIGTYARVYSDTEPHPCFRLLVPFFLSGIRRLAIPTCFTACSPEFVLYKLQILALEKSTLILLFRIGEVAHTMASREATFWLAWRLHQLSQFPVSSVL